MKAVHAETQESWAAQLVQNLDGNAVYRCPNASTPVYRLVKEFLVNGNVLPQYTSFGVSNSDYSTILSQGGIFFQIVNTSGYAISYPSSTSALVPTFVHIAQNKRITAESLEHGAGDTESQRYGIEMVYGTLPAGDYRLLTKEADYTQSFLVQPVPVEGGRMTVCRLRSDGRLLKETVTARLETNGGTLPSPYENGYLTALAGYPYGTLPVPAKPGHRFDGWYTTPDYGAIVGSATLASAQNTTLYAKLTPLTYLLSFNSNGGTGSMKPQQFLYDVPKELPPCTFAREGHAFVGWSAEPSGPVCASDGDLVAIRSNTELHAVWEPAVPLETVFAGSPLAFTTGGATPWFGQEAASRAGTACARSAAIPNGTNSWLETSVYGPGTVSFWWSADSEGIAHDYLAFLVDGEERARIGGTNVTWRQQSIAVTSGGAHTLRWDYTKNEADAHVPDCGRVDEIVWTPATFTVTFHTNGGECGAEPRARLYEETVGELPEATRRGHTFLGWFTKADGGEEITSDTPVTADLACQAHWQINTYTVTFDTSDGNDPLQAERVYDTAIGALPRPVRDGFRFRGWYSGPDGGSRIRSSTRVVDDMTVYARWTAGGESAYRLYPSPVYGNFPDSFKGGTFNGYATDADGKLAGTLVLKVKKPKKGAASAAATLTFTSRTTGKRMKLVGAINLQTGAGTGALSGLLAGPEAIGGTVAKVGEIDGGIDAVKAKRADLVSALVKFNRRVYGIVLETLSSDGTGSPLANGFSTLSIAFSSKGKAKVSGVLADGTKVSLSAQLVAGRETCCLPVLYPKKSRFGFTAWFDRQTLELLDLTAMSEWKKTVKPSFEAGWDVFETGPVGRLGVGTRTVVLDPGALYSLVPSAIAQTPGEIALNVTGKSAWNAGKAAKVVYRNGTVSVNGANVSGLKLSFVPKTGLFKGSFTVYSVSRQKLLRHKFAVNGIVIDNTGYGNCFLKNKGAFPLWIE